MKQPTGFQKPLKSAEIKEVGLAVVTMGRARNLEYAQCSCNWTQYHTRLKVLEDRIDAHLDKKHNGRGIRL